VTQASKAERSPRAGKADSEPVAPIGLRLGAVAVAAVFLAPVVYVVWRAATLAT
jgi:hypothetical protein